MEELRQILKISAKQKQELGLYFQITFPFSISSDVSDALHRDVAFGRVCIVPFLSAAELLPKDFKRHFANHESIVGSFQLYAAQELSRILLYVLMERFDEFRSTEGKLVDVYASFCDHATPRLVSLLDQHPVIQIVLVNKISALRTSFRNLCIRLLQDRELLNEIMSNDKIKAEPILIEFGLGDSHRLSSTVCSVLFDNESRLIYKPRQMPIEILVDKIYRAVAKKKDIPDLYLPYIIERNGYSWCEYIGRTPPERLMDWEKLYNQAGAFAALTTALGIVDVHHENMIVQGSRLFCIDFECLNPNAAHLAKMTAQSCLERSLDVLNAGILPPYSPMHHSANYPNILFPIRQRPGRRLQWSIEKLNTSTMHLSELEVPSSGWSNNPCPLDRDTAKKNLLHGFVSMAKAIRQNEKAVREIIEGENLTFEARYLLRTTQSYANISDFIYQGHEGEAVEVLGALFSDVGDELPLPGARKEFQRIVLDEIKQIIEGDVPYFSLMGKKAVLVGGSGQYETWTAKSARDIVACSFAHFRAVDPSNYAIVIDATLDSVDLTPMHSDTLGGKLALPSHQRLIERLADTIVSYCIQDSETPQARKWLYRHPVENGKKAALGLTSHDLYKGTAGVALALRYASHVTCISRFGDLSDELFDDFKRAAPKAMNAAVSYDSNNLGSSIGSLIGYWHSIIDENKRDGLLDLFNDYMTKLEEMPSIFDGVPPDLVTGTAAALHFLSLIPENKRRNVTLASGLCESSSNYVRDKVDHLHKLSLREFSMAHGWCGVASFNDDKLLDEYRVQRAAEAIFYSDENPHLGWCNGVAGYLAFAARVHSLRGDGSFFDPIRKTVNLTLQHLEQRNFVVPGGLSLCCGLSGIGDVALATSLADLEEESGQIVDAVFAKCADAVIEGKFDHPYGSSSLGTFATLFQGSSGMLYFMCRREAVEELESLLAPTQMSSITGRARL